MKYSMEIKKIVCIGILCWICLPSCGQKKNSNKVKQETRKAPLSNVIVIAGDDHAAYALGCYGNKTVKTPNLDRLASQATRFDKAYCNSPVCTPSRQSFLSGKMPHATGVTLLSTALSDTVYTIPEHLRKMGFKTAAIGKTHFQSDIDHGFDYVIRQDDPLPLAAAYKEFLKDVNETLPENLKVRKNYRPFKDSARLFWNADGLPGSHFDANDAGTFFANKTNEFIEKNKDNRFCIWVGFIEPHAPFNFPIEYADRIDAGKMVVPTGSPEDDPWVPLVFKPLTDKDKKGIIKSYYTSIEYLDKNIGLILDKLESLKLTSQTLIIYLGDNGYLLNHHKRFEKHTMWEEAVRVPLIIQAGGLDINGRPNQPKVVNSLTELVDLAPTIFEALGVQPPPGLHGKSLLPLLEGKTTYNKDMIFSEYLVDNKAMVRTEKYKYIFTNGESDLGLGYATGNPPAGIRNELFDMQKDPHETTNLAGKDGYETIVANLKQRMLETFRRTHPDANSIPENISVDQQLSIFCRPIEIKRKAGDRK